MEKKQHPYGQNFNTYMKNYFRKREINKLITQIDNLVSNCKKLNCEINEDEYKNIKSMVNKYDKLSKESSINQQEYLSETKNIRKFRDNIIKKLCNTRF